MPDLKPPAALPEGAALFLDFDGTLVELAETPDSIRVPHGLPPLLERVCMQLGGRLAIVSGRSLADLERHLPTSMIAFSGSHGLELRLAEGAPVALSVPAGLDDIADETRRFALGVPGLIVEEKPAGVALHYRRVPGAEQRAVRFIENLAAKHGLSVQRGSMVIELRPSGATKGDALRAFMREPAFAGARPWFVGDDLTDEHGFEAAADLGGAGILVGSPRETAARFRLESVAAVRDWLAAA